MAETKHTPGPWSVDQYGNVTGPEGEAVVGEFGIELDDDFTLITAAPEMYEALEPFEVVADVINPELPDNTEVEMRVGGLPVYYLALGSLRAARLARAKAEG